MGTTFLDVTRGGSGKTAVFQFTAEGSGCPGWQGIVDATAELFDPLAEYCGSTVERRGGGSRHQMGRGAQAEVSLAVAACVLVALREHPWAADGLEAGRFVIRNEVVPVEALPAAAEAVARWRAHDGERKKTAEAERKRSDASELVTALQKLGRTETDAPEREAERKAEDARIAESLKDLDQLPDAAGAPPSEDLTFTTADDPTVGD